MMLPVDGEARFRALFEETYAAVRRYALHRGLSAADADDLVADVYTVAWRKLRDVPAGDPLPWLLAVARNHWRNLIRKQRRERDLPARLGPQEASAPAARDDAVVTALASLPEADQEILRLIAWDDLTPQQAATVLGCTAVTARVRLHRARKRFEETLRASQTQGMQTAQEVSDGR